MEMLFGQLSLMTDGCGKLDARQLEDVLKRLTLTSALRMVPAKVRGFKFLSYLKQHMTSYKPDDDEQDDSVTIAYPRLEASNGSVAVFDSSFDVLNKKKKRIFSYHGTTNLDEYHSRGDVRGYHKKF